MQNFICDGKSIEVVATAAILSGDVVVASNIVGVAATSAAIGETVAVSITGVFLLVKAAGTSWNQGDKIYWDATNKVVTSTAASNTLMGYAYKSAASADTSAYVKLLFN